MLKALAIVLGVFVIVVRGLIVLSPGQFRDVAASIANRRSFLRWMGIFVLALALLIFLALDYDVSGARLVMAVIGTLCFLVGILLLALPGEYAELLELFLKFPDSAIRLLASIGVGIGALILYMGIAYY
jgi:uncharacterized protein YjeT (DUF2065 family)